MYRWVGKVAVVTGASAGIGLATAKTFVGEGLIVVGLARRKDKMENEMTKVEGPGQFYARECDITDENAVAKSFEWIKETLGTVHILINNAGTIRKASIEALFFVRNASFSDAKIEDIHFVINLNLMGLIYCSRQSIKLMKANGEECHIVNINSIAGHKTPTFEGKFYNVYSATKFAVKSLSETLTHELRGNKIRVSNLSPGLVRTEIFQAANLDLSFLEFAPGLTPEDVAQSILHVIAVPAHVQITELTIKPLGEQL